MDASRTRDNLENKSQVLNADSDFYFSNERLLKKKLIEAEKNFDSTLYGDLTEKTLPRNDSIMVSTRQLTMNKEISDKVKKHKPLVNERLLDAQRPTDETQAFDSNNN